MPHIPKDKGKNKAWAILSKELAKHHISWSDHRTSPHHLLSASRSFRAYMSTRYSVHDQILWFQRPISMSSILDNYPNIREAFATENSAWLNRGIYI